MNRITDASQMAFDRVYFSEYLIGYFAIFRLKEVNDSTRIHGNVLINDWNNASKTHIEFKVTTLCFHSDDRYCREATYEEIQWLEACERAGKYIPKNKIKAGYESYY